MGPNEVLFFQLFVMLYLDADLIMEVLSRSQKST